MDRPPLACLLDLQHVHNDRPEGPVLLQFNPVLTIGTQIAEAVRAHQPLGRRQARAAALELLRSVGLADAFRREFVKAGGRVVADLKYSEGDSDFSAQLTAIV